MAEILPFAKREAPRSADEVLLAEIANLEAALTEVLIQVDLMQKHLVDLKTHLPLPE